MPALVAGIHVFTSLERTKTWMAGTSPAMTGTGIVNRTNNYHPPPPPPPPPPPEKPPPPDPLLDPGASDADAIVLERSPPRLLAKPTGSCPQSWLPEYHVAVAPAAAAAARTPAKRCAQWFSTSSAIA